MMSAPTPRPALADPQVRTRVFASPNPQRPQNKYDVRSYSAARPEINRASRSISAAVGGSDTGLTSDLEWIKNFLTLTF